jgi:hypothetical protein
MTYGAFANGRWFAAVREIRVLRIYIRRIHLKQRSIFLPTNLRFPGTAYLTQPCFNTYDIGHFAVEPEYPVSNIVDALEVPMNTRIKELLEEIRQREEQLAEVLKHQEAALSYRLDGTKVEFEKSVKQAHMRLKTGILRWFWDSELRNVASAPVIYLMIVPFVILDAMVSFTNGCVFPCIASAEQTGNAHRYS